MSFLRKLFWSLPLHFSWLPEILYPYSRILFNMEDQVHFCVIQYQMIAVEPIFMGSNTLVLFVRMSLIYFHLTIMLMSPTYTMSPAFVITSFQLQMYSEK